MSKETQEQKNLASDNQKESEVATSSDASKETNKFSQAISKILVKIKMAWVVVWGKTVMLYNKVSDKIKNIIKNLKEKKKNAQTQNKNEQADEKAKSVKTKKSTQKRTFDLKKIFNEKIIKIVSIVLASVFCLLGAIQVGLFGFGIYNNINYILDIIKQKDIFNIVCFTIASIFILVLLIQIITSISALVNKKRKFNLAVLSTLFATYLACVFFKVEMQSDIMLKLGFATPILNIGGIVAILFAIMCFIGKNVRERLVPIITALVCCVLGCLIYALKMSDFISYQVDGVEIAIGNIDILEYITCLVSYTKGGEISSFSYETLLILSSKNSLILFEMLDCSFVINILNLIIIVFAKLIPYIAMSILGYFLIVISSEEARQIKALKSMGSIGKYLLASICFILASAIGLYFLKIEYLQTTINYIPLIFVAVISLAITFIASITFRIKYGKVRKNIKKLAKV